MFILYLIFIISIYLGNVLITFLHEIGHAIPMALYTKNEVDVYLGSHGQKKIKNISFRIWKLNFNANCKLWAWKGGLCSPKPIVLSIKQQIIYTLIGPITPTIIFAILAWLAYWFNENFYISIIINIIFIYSLLLTIYNLTPKKKPLTIYKGHTVYNDGYTIRRLLKLKKFSLEYMTANDAYNNKDYKKAGRLYKELLNKGAEDEYIYKMAISSFVMERDFDPIKSIYKDYQNIFSPQADDLINIGYCCIMTGEESIALKYFKKSLELSESWHALNNIGYILNLQGDYFQAIDYFNRALLIDTHIYSYNNRGFAKIKLGDIEAGLKDLEHSHDLDPNDSYYYKNMGIYYFDINKFSKALEFFEKAKMLDEFTHNINKDIKMALNMIESTKNTPLN